MANSFLKSPYEDVADATIDTDRFEVVTPAPAAKKTATVQPSASRGMQPSREDVMKRAAELDIDPKLAVSFFSQESSGNWDSKDSPRGARGGFQVMPGTYRSMMGTDAGQTDPWNNMEAGLRYIRYGQDTLKTRDPLLLAAGYHAGYDRSELKRGIIPDTNDGMISTADYARNIAARVRGEKPGAATKISASNPLGNLDPNRFEVVDDKGKPAAALPEGLDPDRFEIVPQKDDFEQRMAAQEVRQKAVDDQPLLDYFGEKGSRGFNNMLQSLDLSRWALGGGDTEALANSLAKKISEDRNRPKSTGEQENDAAFKAVSNAKGAWDTTVAGFKAVGTAITNPKATAGEVVEQFSNALPTIVGGTAGAGTGAAVGGGTGAVVAGVGAVPGAITGAIWGGRVGMAAGTTATELGGEVEYLIQKRLEDGKLAPTAQNILAIMNDKGFREEARNQGLAKGLTVAAVDALTLKMGGRIVSAPGKKIALNQLEEQGVDVASRAARNKALASPAGREALKNAKPGLGARSVAGVKAGAVDVAGEVVGEGLSQQVARGEVDYGDALREGVMSLGQAAVEPAIGGAMETAKAGVNAVRGGVSEEAAAPAPIVQTADAPSKANGPLERARENAGKDPERVTVNDANGEQVTGVVTGTSTDGAVQIVGDNGEVFNFNIGENGITITPEANNTPLSNALEVAAEDNALEFGKMFNQPKPEQAAKPVSEKINVPAAPVVADLKLLEEPELRERLKYIADQAKTNGGWNKMLSNERQRIKAEINSRLAPPAVPETVVPAAPVSSPANQPVQTTPAQEAAATLPKALAGAKPRYAYGKKQFELSFASDFDRAAYIAAQDKPSKRDAEYLAFAMQNGGMNEAEVRAHGAQVRAAIKAMAKDAGPGVLKVPSTPRSSVTIESTPNDVSAPITLSAPSQPSAGSAATESPALADVALPAESGPARDAGASAVPAKPAPLKTVSKDDAEHLFGVPAKRAKALERIKKGTAFFGDKAKAQDFITKNGLKDTHEVVQTGKVRFEVMAKQVDGAKQTKTDIITEHRVTDAEGKPATLIIKRDKADPSKVAEVKVKTDGERAALTLGAQGVLTDEQLIKNLTDGDVINGNDNRTAGQRDGAEAVGQAADAGQAEGAAVQSDARQAKAEREVRKEQLRAADDWWTGANRSERKALIREKYTEVIADTNSRLEWNEMGEGMRERVADILAGMNGQNDELDAEMRSYEAKAEKEQTKPAVSPLTQARNDLIDLNTQVEQQGQVVDDRLLERVRRQEKLIADLESEQNLAAEPDASAELLDRIAKAYGYDEPGKMPAGLAKTATKLRDALIQRNRGMLEQILHPSNPNSRKAFEALFAGQMKLPKGVAGTNQVIADFLGQVNEQVKAETAPAAAEPAPTAQFAGNKIFTQSAVDKARARLKSKLNQLNSGIDPEMMIDGITIAGAYMETGVRKFADYAKAMTADFGDAIKPYLLSFYEGARNYPGLTTTGMDSVEDARNQHDALMRTEEKNNEPESLAEPSQGKLEGAQPDLLQGAEPSREAGAGAEGSSRTNARRDERAGGSRVQQSGSVGDDTGEVPVSATRTGKRGSGKQGGGAVQRSDKPAKRNPAIDAGGDDLLTPQTGSRAQDRSDDFVITDEDAIGEGGAKTKFKQNIAAIKLLKELVSENRQATRAEQAVLAKYVGWGGIPQAFYRDNNEVTKGWEKEAAELKSVMTEAELAAAASSTRNAHYTSPEIVSAVWDAAKHFGFQGGRVLEPSVGVGNFFGLMPGELRSASQLTGVELDHITGGIAKQLYPQANINAPVGFQEFSAPDNYFDLAIGNPPFGREGIYDPTRKKISNFSIHNYFFAKSIDTVKPNGVLAMVVTNRLLDSTADKARQYIADRAEFLGAIRLPNDAFMKNANTQVTTDIIFLRKLAEGEQSKGASWMDVKPYTDEAGKTVALNEYFVKNPDMMLGDFGAYGSMYGPDEAALVAKPGQDTPALLQKAIATLPRGFMDGPTAEPTRETITPARDISAVKIGSVFEQGGKIFERREDMLGNQQAKEVEFASDKARERVTGMIRVRDALTNVRSLQLSETVKEKDLEAARAELNKVYDAFVKTNGPLNADANKRLMRDDPSWPQIAALEDKFDKGITKAVAKTTGETPREPSAQKAAIFSKRTQSPYKAPEKASTAKDAMVSSLAERGRVDLDYMASLYAGHTPEQIAKELEGLIFKNPVGGWESRDQYLSGNVKKKLAQAIEAAKSDPSLKANVAELQAVQPADIEAVDIDVKTGAHWIPADVMQNFVETISEGQNAKAVYNPVNASWTLSVERVPQSAQTQWATDRASLTNILEAAANQKQIVIRDKQYDGSSVLNEAATTAANEKVERVKTEWKNWIWQDDARRERLARIYNDVFNTDVQREFDGSHLTFPGKVGNDIIALRPHQANAIWRMVQSGTTLLDHVVGAGKTFTMIGGIMEMRRMGLAKKPMLVVPNHLVGQWAEDFMKLYPGANILAATKKDFEKENRKKLFARIATGDWDAVIVAHSSFGKVEVEPEFQEQFIKQQIADMDTSISAMRAAEGKGSRNVKQIEKQKAALEEKLKRLFDTGAKDDNLYFNELGVDAVLLDEAHEFKNLGFSTGMQRVAGLGNAAGSNKAADMLMKVQSVLKRTGGKNVVFATGTPISNTMAEMYTMQRFLDYGTLKDQGIAHFDAWAKTFGEVVTDWELSPSGQYKMNSRFAKFVNMPELMQRYGSFADVINRDDINRQLAAQGKKLPVPKIAGGKPENTVVDRSTDQAQYIGEPMTYDDGREVYPEHSLIYRSEHLPKGPAMKGADNMLKIMSDARKAALDMRLIDPSYPDNPNSKVNVAAGNIKSIYDKWSPQKGTQLVFIDLSTPKGAKAKEAAALRDLVAKAAEGDEAAQEKLDAMSPDELMALDGDFSVYDDLKQKLINQGIPENEIAFIHDANTELQKEELFAKVRSGRVRVLFGSTAKMGAGMNVQERLVALHHLDAPWRPSDLEQREGRIIRQGNALYDADPENFEIRILRYATKQTLDSRMWQTIEAKARFIEQVRKGTGEREVEDVAGEAANSAEMKAASSGNPLILEEMTLRQSIRKMENKQAEHNREQYRIKDRIRMLGQQADILDRNATKMEADAPLAPKEFAVKIGNQTFEKHGEAGEAIMSAIDAMYKAKEDSREIGTYGGFKVRIDDATRGTQSIETVLTLVGNDEYQTEANPGSNPSGLSLRMQNTVKSLSAEASKARAQSERNRADIPKLESQIGEWDQKEALADAKAKHLAVIDQLKPKKPAQPAQANPDEAKPAFSRGAQSDTKDMESIFAGLDGNRKAKKKAEQALEGRSDAAAIRYVDENFWNILGELEKSGKVGIKCQ